MHFSNLKQICDLIRILTPYRTYSTIAEQLGITEPTLRGYWDRYANEIPDAKIDRVAELVQKVAAVPLTREAALNLMRGSSLMFHNALLPIAGDSWRQLTNESEKLRIIKRPAHSLGFGEVDEEDEHIADDTVPLKKNFRFEGDIPWSGEGFLVAEHRDEWHVLALSGNERGFQFAAGAFVVPPPRNGKSLYLIEKKNTGYYRYFVIALRGRLLDSLRHQIHRANPYSQSELDLLASIILQAAPKDRKVLAASLRIGEEGE